MGDDIKIAVKDVELDAKTAEYVATVKAAEEARTVAAVPASGQVTVQPLQTAIDSMLLLNSGYLQFIGRRGRSLTVPATLNNAGPRVYTKVAAFETGIRLVARTIDLSYHMSGTHAAATIAGLIQFGWALGPDDGTGQPITSALVGDNARQGIIILGANGAINTQFEFSCEHSFIKEPQVGRANDDLWVWHSSQGFGAGTIVGFAQFNTLWTREEQRELEGVS